MSLKKNEMTNQDPKVRARNFNEVALGYTPEQAVDEAQRCLGCKNRSCVAGCPVKIDIPEFLACVAKGEFEEAYNIISRQSSLPAVWNALLPITTMPTAKNFPLSPKATATRLRLSVPALQVLPARGIWQRRATTLPFSRRST